MSSNFGAADNVLVTLNHAAKLERLLETDTGLCS